MLYGNTKEEAMIDSNFNFAVDVLTGKRSNEINVDSNGNLTRDNIFNSILDQLRPLPVSICQVGAIETFDSDWRIGSGWSDLIFGKYVKEHGSELTIVDINLDNLANSFLASQQLGYEVVLIHDDAARYLGNLDWNHHIYYLDGGNEPEQTLEQFNKIKDKDSIVIIDDFEIKGSLLPEDVLKSVTFYPIANGIGVLDLTVDKWHKGISLPHFSNSRL